MTINSRVKKIRLNLGLNQTEFGERIAIAQGYLTNIENGRRDVTEKILKLICLEFNVGETWLRTGEGQMFEEISRDEAITIWAAKVTRPDFNNSFVKEFAEMLTKLDENDWKTVEKMAKLLAEGQKKD